LKEIGVHEKVAQTYLSCDCVNAVDRLHEPQKAVKVNPLETENQQLRAEAAGLRDEVKKAQDALTALKYEKDMQIEKLQGELKNLENVEQEKEQKIRELEDAKKELEAKLQTEIEQYRAKLAMTDRGLVITFLDEVLLIQERPRCAGRF
jgi:chromosome segregation ATPase